MEREQLINYICKGTNYAESLDDMKRELVLEITDLVLNHGGKMQFLTNKQYEEGDADYDDLLTARLEDEFGHESHTYVIETIEVAHPSPNIKIAKVTCHRLEYNGFSPILTPSLWYFSNNDLVKMYQTIVDNIEMEMDSINENVEEA